MYLTGVKNAHTYTVGAPRGRDPAILITATLHPKADNPLPAAQDRHEQDW